ncbi:MAG: PqqD family protein [Campylobacterota bacterium]|nr:PqqD family protein [Campylobacterota bacterium]
MNLDNKITFAETVFAQEVDGEIVLLDMKSENYFGLDEVGSSIWQAMESGKTIREVREIVLNQYDVESDVLERDLLGFIKKLVESGLIELK